MGTHDLTPEESLLFRQAVRGVVPLASTPKLNLSAPKRKRPQPAQPKATQPETAPSYATDSYSFPNELSGTDIMCFQRNGISWKQMRRLKRGQDNEAHLDLHRQTVPEAEASVSLFIQQSIQNGKRSVCLVHGKGLLSSAHKPALKNFLNRYLRDHPQVLAFHSAPPNRGGTGALYLLLKR